MVNPAVAVLLECFVPVVMMTQQFAKIVLLDITRIKKLVLLVYRAFLDERKEKTVQSNVINVLSTSTHRHRTKRLAKNVAWERLRRVRLEQVSVRIALQDDLVN